VTNANGGTITCNWRPSVRGSIAISAIFISGAYRDVLPTFSLMVSGRGGLR
jgi:hypothetical protein